MPTFREAGGLPGLVVAVGLLVAGLTSGCSSSSNNSNGPTQTTAVSTLASTTSAPTSTGAPSATTSGPSASGSGSPSGSAPASGSGAPSSGVPSAQTSLPSKSATPSGKPALPSSCSSLLDSQTLTDALGKSLDGETSYIKGVAEPKIDRTGRTTCRYGVKDTSVPVEVGVSGYGTVDAATTRMGVTIQAEVDAGAQKVPVKVANLDGTILLGKNGSTILVQLQNRTVAITLAPNLAKDPQKALTQIAGTVLANLP